MASCAVKGCSNTRKFLPVGNNISFHTFPKTQDRQKIWLSAIGKDPTNWEWSRNKVVCSEHFTENDFIVYANKRGLKLHAVPSLNLQIYKPTISCLADSSLFVSDTISNASTSRVEISGQEPCIKRPKKKKRKRPHIETRLESSSTTASSDSSIKRRKIQLVKSMHSYSISPSKIKTQYTLLKNKQVLFRKRLYKANKKIVTLKKKVQSMRSVMDFMKKNQQLSDHAADHVEKTYDSVPKLLMSRYLRNVSRESITHEAYPPVLRQFAATLQFYSNKAYEEVRREFALALPHPATIRKWYQNVNCEPGFMGVAFDALKQQVTKYKKNGSEVICSLMVDEISIKKQLDFDGQQMWGYVNIGVGTDNDELKPASDAFVVLVVCHNAHWKIPIAYFFIASLNAKEKANIINESLIRLYDIGVAVTSLTFDGLVTNFSMMKELGCNLENVKEMKTWFAHPSDSLEKIFCMPDPCHMLKLLRNNWANLEKIINPEGKIVDWLYVKRLFEIQESEGLTIANKLKRAHMEWYRQKMKVHLAAQTLSKSIADAIDFLNKELGVKEFQGSEATTDFLRKVDCLFDVLNSRSPQAKGFKAPLRMSNADQWKPFIIGTVEYLLNCTDVGGRPLWHTPKKTPFIGFAISALSICGIFEQYVETGRLSYLLTYKLSQDHLEIFFCWIRSRNGWNNNPSCLQFMRTIRRLLLHTRISQGQGNCKVLDATTILSVPSTSVKSTEESIDIFQCRKYSYEPADHLLDHDYDCLEHFFDLSCVVLNVVTYISGFVIKMLQKSMKCADCLLGCESSTDVVSDDSYSLISFKNKGGLHIPSYGLVKICQSTEISIRNLLLQTNNRLPKEKNFLNIFVLANALKHYQNIYQLFPNLNEHFLESFPFDENHGFILVKGIIRAYCRIRFFNLAKKFTEIIQGPLVRRELNKLILFNHQ